MGRRYGAVVAMVMLTAGFARAEAGESRPAPPSLPRNLEVAVEFRMFVDDLWRRSPTFQRQCERVASANGVRVRILAEDLPRPPSSRARSTFRHAPGALLSAEIYLPRSIHLSELIGHEMEHVVEQLDRVSLTALAGGGAVWKTGDGAFETRRAIEAGEQVQRELLSKR